MYRYERNRDEEREGAGNHEGGFRLRASPQMRELLAEKQQYTPPTKERDIHPARMRELVPGKAEQVPANSASVRNLFDTASARADHVPDPLSEIEGAACKDNAFPQVHAAALLVRDMSEVEYAVFRDDIAANGLREPIKVLDGEIIDGRNRMRACRETGTSPRFETVETDDPWGYVRSANIARRHLSVAERAMEAASVATRTRADRKKYNTGKSADVAAPTQEEAAKTYNVSERSVRKAKRIFDSGNLTVIEKVRSGEMSIHQGERRVKRIARDARAEDRRDAMERASVDVEIDIRHCSCADLRKAVDAGSVDLIVTDPPYSRSSLPVWLELGGFAVHALRPGGFLVSMCSNIYARESEAALEEAGMRIWPRMVYALPGAKESVQYGRLSFLCEAKFLIVASNGGLTEPVSLDSNLVRPPYKSVQDNTRHEWEQSVGGMAEICRRFMKVAGMVVADPFLGSGTTFEAAAGFKPSRMIGCDIDGDHCRVARKRLH